MHPGCHHERVGGDFRKYLEAVGLTKKWREFSTWTYIRRVQRIEWLSVFGQCISEKDADVEEDKV
jgi:hypothetical protein